MEQKIRRYYIVTAAVLAGVVVYQLIHITGPVMLPDEFGYWANAAQLLGYDWSGAASLQSYYSFGYSILLLPLLRWVRDPSVMYKTAVLFNAVLVYFHALLLWKIANRSHPEKEEFQILFCMLAAFYPSIIFNMQLTWTESLVSLLFLLSVWLMWERCRSKSMLCGILLGGCLFYLYMVHMRTLGVAIAGMIALFFLWRWEGRRLLPKTLLWAGIIFVLFLLSLCLKEYFQNGVYAKAGQAVVHINDYQGQTGKLARLFTAEGLGDFAVSCAGKLFYLGLASLGTVYFGIWHVLKRAGKSPVYLYILLAALFTFGITALYTIGGGRADSYIYGRYNEFAAPVFIYFGLCEMSENRYTGRAAVFITALHAGMAYMLIQVMAASDPDGFQGYFTVGISYALKEYLPDCGQYIFRGFAAGTAALLMLALMLGFFIRKKKGMVVYFALFIGLYLYTGLSAGEKYLYDHSIDSREDMALAGVAREGLGEKEGVVFVNSDSDQQYVDILQFALQDHPVEVVQEKDFVLEQDKLPGFVFVYQSTGKEALLEKYYDTVLNTYHFKLYYNDDKR